MQNPPSLPPPCFGKAPPLEALEANRFSVHKCWWPGVVFGGCEVGGTQGLKRRGQTPRVFGNSGAGAGAPRKFWKWRGAAEFVSFGGGRLRFFDRRNCAFFSNSPVFSNLLSPLEWRVSSGSVENKQKRRHGDDEFKEKRNHLREATWKEKCQP